MNIIFNEIKKIFRPVNVAIIILITAVIWFLFMTFNIENFPNGSDKYIYDVSVKILNEYGTSMDKEEFADLKKYREKRAKEASEYLLTKDVFVKSGLSTYDEFVNRAKNKSVEKLDELYSNIMFEENNYLFWELQELDYAIDRYENKDFWIGLGGLDENQAQKQRHENIRNSDATYSPLNFRIMENYHALIFGITLLILICVPTLIIPIFINDNKNKVNYIQYSSKTGRKLFEKKIVASIVASFVLATVQLGILFVVYKANNTYMFWDCNINSAISDMASWYDIAFGQYIILSVVLNYIVAFITCMISIFVSSKVSTYISAIGIQIPILFPFGIWLNDRGMKYLTTTFYQKYSLQIIYLGLIILLLFMIFRRIKKEIIADV